VLGINGCSGMTCSDLDNKSSVHAYNEFAMISHQPIISAPKYPNVLVALAQTILFLEMLKCCNFYLFFKKKIFVKESESDLKMI
jgi:hypothetical protein